MLKTGTVAAILAFCAISSAAPANKYQESGNLSSWTTSTILGTATGWAPQSTADSSDYSSSLSYAHGGSYSTKEADSTATGTAAVPTGSNSGASASSNTGAAAPATPTGLSKVQQILLSDTRADAVNNVLKDNSDFVFDFNKARKFGPGKGGEVVLANRKAFPALTGTDIAMAVTFLGPCGFNTPHVHNRATEFLIVTKGKVMSEMVIENGVGAKPRDIMNTIEELQATPYFMGSLHTQFNPTCDDAVFVAPLSDEDPGTNTMAQAYFALNDDTIRAAAGNAIDGADVDKFRGLLSTNVALGIEQCLKQCNISKRK
ncbi:RmlC-like cupin domain-containing protein [Hypoxylon sp. FL1857]|nr:RmlC-like cupin domain-containing protein [Hypoxylon sp. FL1857]